ncbi:Uncharacterized protein QTN25_008626 [Entamoeba marina]
MSSLPPHLTKMQQDHLDTINKSVNQIKNSYVQHESEMELNLDQRFCNPFVITTNPKTDVIHNLPSDLSVLLRGCISLHEKTSLLIKGLPEISNYFVFYGEYNPYTKKLSEEVFITNTTTKIDMITSSIPVIQSAIIFSKKCFHLVRAIVRFISSAIQNNIQSNFKTLFQDLGKLLSAHQRLCTTIKSNTIFTEHFNFYNNLIATYADSSNVMDSHTEKIRSLLEVLVSFQNRFQYNTDIIRQDFSLPNIQFPTTNFIKLMQKVIGNWVENLSIKGKDEDVLSVISLGETFNEWSNNHGIGKGIEKQLEEIAKKYPIIISIFDVKTAINISDEIRKLRNGRGITLEDVMKQNKERIDKQLLLKGNQYITTQDKSGLIGIELYADIKRQIILLLYGFGLIGKTTPISIIEDILRYLVVLKQIENRISCLTIQSHEKELKIIQKNLASIKKNQLSLKYNDLLPLLFNENINNNELIVIEMYLDTLRKEYKNEKIEMIQQEIDIIIQENEIQQSLKNVSNFTFFFFVRYPLLEKMYQFIFSDMRFTSYLSILNTFVSSLESNILKSQILNALAEEVITIIKKCIILPIENQIEEELRLQIYGELNVTSTNIIQSPPKEIVSILKSDIVVFGKNINIQQQIKQSLELKFYKHFNWDEYQRMRILAEKKYGLLLFENYVIGQTTIEGLDILIIMKNIQSFVMKFHYNLYTQCFIEREADGNRLSAIGVQQVSESIKTHGLGIMSTCVNNVYLYLLKQFSLLDEFLYDDQIKGILVKSLKNFDGKNYTLEMAEMDVKEFQRLGVRKIKTNQKVTNSSYLELFRLLTTFVGNSIGFVRLIRTGGLIHCSKTVEFIPDLFNVPDFVELTSKESNDVKKCAQNFMNVINEFTKSYKGTDLNYLPNLVQVFHDELNSSRHSHLKYFYISLPSLLLTYLDFIIAAKERLIRNSSNLDIEGYIMSDDGFLLGIAYILSILNQKESFYSLHFIEGLEKLYTTKLKNEQLNMKKGSKDKMLASSVLINKYSVYLKEVHLLKISLDCALNLFL